MNTTMKIVPLVLLLLLSFSLMSFADVQNPYVGSNHVLKCRYDNAVVGSIYCTWELYPFYPWGDYEYPTGNMYELTGGDAQCILNYNYNTSYTACGFGRTCYGYLGVSGSLYLINNGNNYWYYSQNDSNLNDVYYTPYYKTMTYSGGRFSANLSGIPASTYVWVECKAVGLRFVNAVNVWTSPSYPTGTNVQNISMYSNGTNLYLHPVGAKVNLSTIVAFDQNGSTIYFKLPDYSLSGIPVSPWMYPPGAPPVYTDIGFPFGLNYHVFALAPYNLYAPSTTKILEYYVGLDSISFGAIGIEHVGIMTYIQSGSGPLCNSNRYPNEACNTDCDCLGHSTGNYLGGFLECSIGVCKVPPYGTCTTSNDCETGYACQYYVFPFGTCQPEEGYGDIPTTLDITLSPDLTVYPTESNFTITPEYRVESSHALVPETTDCCLAIDSSTPTCQTCTSFFNIFTQNASGYHWLQLTANKTGYESQTYTRYFRISAGTTNLSTGSVCTSNSQCASGRCAFVFGDVVELTMGPMRCYTDEDCETLLPPELFGFSYCPIPGFWCRGPSYSICVADDGYSPCNWNLVGYDSNSYYCPVDGERCNPSTFTCSLTSTSTNGVVCSTNAQCLSGYCGSTNTPGISVCCEAGSTICCTQEYGCPVGQICSIYTENWQSFKCIIQTTIPTPLCVSNENCSQQNLFPWLGYYCNSLSGTCIYMQCDSGYTPCYYNKTGTMTLECLPSSLCFPSGGTNPPAEPPSAGEVGTEAMFNDILNLLYYVIVTVIIFFMIAVFISGLHLAYGLVKR